MNEITIASSAGRTPWCLRYFTYEHLPEGKLRECSKQFADAAHLIRTATEYVHYDEILEKLLREITLPSNIESDIARSKTRQAMNKFYYSGVDERDYHSDMEEGMRLLLEAKDCAIRSLLDVSNGQ